MTRYQKLTLLILALIFVAVVALVAVTALRQTGQTVVVLTPTTSPAPVLSSEDMTMISAVQFAGGEDISLLSAEQQTQSAAHALTLGSELARTVTAEAQRTTTPSP